MKRAAAISAALLFAASVAWGQGASNTGGINVKKGPCGEGLKINKSKCQFPTGGGGGAVGPPAPGAPRGGASGLTSNFGLQGNIFTPADDGHFMYGDNECVALGAGDDFTLAMRFYHHELVASSHAMFAISEFNGTNTDQYENGIIMMYVNSTSAQVRHYDDDGVFATHGFVDGFSNWSGLTIPEDQYTTWVVTYDGSGDDVRFYLDGSIETETPVIAFAALSDGPRCLIVFDSRDAVQSPFGYSSHYGMWDRVLTAAEITGLDAIDSGDWTAASGGYGASAASALIHYYVANDGTVLDYQTDKVGTHNLPCTVGVLCDNPVDGQFTAHGSEEADATP